MRAALLDENGAFLRMDEVEDRDALTARHLAQITSCDLPSGKYLWVADRDNPYGGAFWEIAWLKRVTNTRAVATRERASVQEVFNQRATARAERKADDPVIDEPRDAEPESDTSRG